MANNIRMFDDFIFEEKNTDSKDKMHMNLSFDCYVDMMNEFDLAIAYPEYRFSPIPYDNVNFEKSIECVIPRFVRNFIMDKVDEEGREYNVIISWSGTLSVKIYEKEEIYIIYKKPNLRFQIERYVKNLATKMNIKQKTNVKILCKVESIYYTAYSQDDYY